MLGISHNLNPIRYLSFTQVDCGDSTITKNGNNINYVAQSNGMINAILTVDLQMFWWIDDNYLLCNKQLNNFINLSCSFTIIKYIFYMEMYTGLYTYKRIYRRRLNFGWMLRCWVAKGDQIVGSELISY